MLFLFIFGVTHELDKSCIIAVFLKRSDGNIYHLADSAGLGVTQDFSFLL